MTFRLALKAEGANPLYWQTLDQLIGFADIPIDPDFSYTPQSDVVKAVSGLSFPRGFASAMWHFNALTNTQRQTLKSFCPNLSAEVYIETLSNEQTVCGDDEWIQALAVMNWTAGDETKDSNKTLGLDIVFTHLVEI